MVAVTVTQSIALLIFVAPLCLFVAWSDLRTMKIPTWSTDALALVFVIVGLGLVIFGAMPFAEYAWRYSQFFVVLILAMVANAIGAMGAGDSKFLASAAPFVALSDVGFVFMLLGVGTITAFVIHRIAKAITPIRNLVADWESWHQAKRFPLGFPLAGTLILYLAWPLLF